MELLAPTYHGIDKSDLSAGTQDIATTDRTGVAGYNRSVPVGWCPTPEGADDGYTFCFGGTSASTPMVAGVAGLILSVNPNLTRKQVQDILQQTADKIEPSIAKYDATGFSKTHGYGKVNAHKAASAASAIATDLAAR